MSRNRVGAVGAGLKFRPGQPTASVHSKYTGKGGLSDRSYRWWLGYGEEAGHQTTITRWEEVGGRRIQIRMATATC